MRKVLLGNENFSLSEISENEKVRRVVVSIEDNVRLIQENFGNKLSFSISETASILNMSYDFVREKILSGKILAVSFGDRKMVHLNELARVLTFGV